MAAIDIAGEQTNTVAEIFSQPRCWEECLLRLSTAPELPRIAAMAKPDAEWLFVGCGSSFYLALSAAATFNHLGIPARAVPASEVLLYPELAMPAGRTYIPVMISRSGLTSEVVRAARSLELDRDIRTVGISCSQQSPLERITSQTIVLTPADEKSTVMTRSFTSMLLGLQYTGASLVGNEAFCRALMDLPAQTAPVMEMYAPQVRDFVSGHSFEDYVVLAQGPLFGIASETMLKITESSTSYSQVFHSMEFRHGPKSIVGAETLLIFLLSETSYDQEVKVLKEMKALGATTLVIANALDTHARQSADLAIELSLTVPEYARLAAYLPWGQLCGVYTGLKKGLNPDSPRNLTRVVVLDGSH
jgi:glucosamine--fructose-6-phosphate aminotransferase (isomerizing)